MSIREKIEKFQESLSDLEENLRAAVETAREAAREADRLDLPGWVSGQLEMYLARNVEQFLEGEHQAGSIVSIREALQGLAEDERSQEEEERAELEQECQKQADLEREAQEEEQLTRESLVAAAARAVEVFGEDELEGYAREPRATRE